MGDASSVKVKNRLIPAIPEVFTDGRDEMNLAEWPIALLSSNGTSPAAQLDANTLVFQDCIKDPRTGALVQRTFTVSATSKWGLPGPVDEDVLLALINLSKLAGFESPTLYFTRYHLLKVLGWPINGVYYERLKQALKRLEGVQLDFERAYWDDQAQSFVDRTFNLYNSLKILEEENSTSKKPDIRQPAFPFASCQLTWSEFLFDGIGERKLKHLDFNLYRSLSSAITRRVYRFLDKRLYDERHSLLRMPLNTFAVAHIGLADGQPAREYKRRLKPAILELEQRGFLKPLPEKVRFQKLRAGLYDIFVERDFSRETVKPTDKATPKADAPAPSPDTSPLVKELIEAGMHKEQAEKIVAQTPDSEIRLRLDILRWRVNSADKPANPGAWLNDQFRYKYPPPDTYIAHLNAKEINREKQQRLQARQKEQLRRQIAKEAAALEYQEAFRTWWSELGEEGRSEVNRTIQAGPHNDFERPYIEQGEQTVSGRAIWMAKRQAIFSERTAKKSPL